MRRPQNRSRTDTRMRISKLASVLFALFAPMGFGVTLRAQQLKPAATVAPVPEKSKAVPPFNRRDRILFYEKTTIAASAFVGPVVGAAVTQWVTDNPPEWGHSFAGYGRRVLGGFSRQAIANTVGLGVMLVDGEDPRHYPTGRHGVWKRGLYAARESVISRNDTTGDLMPAYSRIVGVYTAGFVSNAWYPDRFSNVHDALWRGSTALASDIVWQEFKEFWPDVRRRLRFHR
jgi:hypothetical protein